MPLEMNRAGWDDIAKQVVENECVPRCQAIADACNAKLDERGHPTHKDPNDPGYIVSTEGEKPLQKHDYRATVITKTNEAMVDCAENNTLIYEFGAAAGDVGGGAK